MKRRNTAIVLFLLAAAVSAVVVYRYYRLYKIQRAEATRYSGFGVYMPDGFEIHGIDVSKYQGTISWPAVKQMKADSIATGFAFIKATQGLDRVDRKFRYNWRKSKDAGIIRGAYHFFEPGVSGIDQAKHFIKHVELEPGDLPPVVDVEHIHDDSAKDLVLQLKLFIGIIEKHYKVRPVLYTYANFYERYLAKEFKQYPLWVAHYYQPIAPRVGRKWSFWQHSDRGTVNGITHAVDLNVFNGDSAAFRKLLIR